MTALKPPGFVPSYKVGVTYPERSIVTHDGGCYQARAETEEAPPGRSWRTLRSRSW